MKISEEKMGKEEQKRPPRQVMFQGEPAAQGMPGWGAKFLESTPTFTKGRIELCRHFRVAGSRAHYHCCENRSRSMVKDTTAMLVILSFMILMMLFIVTRGGDYLIEDGKMARRAISVPREEETEEKEYDRQDVFRFSH